MLAAIGTVVAQQRKQPVKKTTISTEEHLCFEGVPIDGSTESFIKALDRKGIKALKDKETDIFVYKGKRCKIYTLAVYRCFRYLKKCGNFR